MRTAAILALALACSVDPDDAQFRCSDGRCPSGQVCVDSLCRDELAGDSGVDGGPLDAAVDDAAVDDATIDAPDAPDADAGSTSEVCTPARGTAADEDGDGAIDEGCPWHFGRPHPVLDVDRGVSEHWSPVVVADSRRLYFAYSGERSGVYLAQRSTPSTRFALDLEPERVFESPTVEPIYTFTITPDERVLVVQVGGELVVSERESADAAFTDIRMIGMGTHPTICADGHEIVFVRGFDLVRIARGRRGEEFGPASLAVTDSSPEAPAFPRMTPDGRSLFYTRGSVLVTATRNATDAPFGDVTGLPDVAGHSLAVSFATREVYFSLPGSDSSPSEQGVWRMELCRDGPCPAQEFECPSTLEPVPGLLGCYGVGGMVSTFGAAADFCETAGGTLASINSAGERNALFAAGYLSLSDPVWSGAVTDSLAPALVAYTWPTDEPFVEYRELWQTRPSEGDLAARCAMVTNSGLLARRCDSGAMVAALCERVHWPFW